MTTALLKEHLYAQRKLRNYKKNVHPDYLLFWDSKPGYEPRTCPATLVSGNRKPIITALE
jgi:hypothetical protein